MTLHTILRGLVVGALALAAFGARAADYPSQPIKIVVPWAAGGFTDVFGRIIADKLTKSLGQPVIVENKPGVLTRIAGLFARRGFNIDTLTVGPTDDEDISRVTLTVDGALHPIDQVTKQLHKLVNVIKIRDLEPAETVARELALFKVSADGASRAEVMQMVEIFRGKIIDVSKRSVIIEVTGSFDKIEAFERMVRPFGLIEMARTGEIAISRGRGET